MTAREKLQTIVSSVLEAPPEQLPDDIRGLVNHLNTARGLAPLVGIQIPENPLEAILPDADADLDVLIDKTIAFLIGLRSDELPAYDPTGSGYGDRPQALVGPVKHVYADPALIRKNTEDGGRRPAVVVRPADGDPIRVHRAHIHGPSWVIHDQRSRPHLALPPVYLETLSPVEVWVDDDAFPGTELDAA